MVSISRTGVFARTIGDKEIKYLKTVQPVLVEVLSPQEQYVFCLVI